MPDFRNDQRIHVYKFLDLALSDYANCRKYGENYKEEEMDKVLTLEVRDTWDEEYEMKKRGYFPDRGGSKDKKRRRRRTTSKDKGMMRTKIRKSRTKSPNIPNRSRKIPGVKHRVLKRKDMISADGMKVSLKKNIHAPRRPEATPRR